MKTTSKILILIFCFCLIQQSKAQDIHFSKFLSAPLILNPANTTNYHGNWSLIANYRNQGINTSDSYVTSSFAFDFPVYIKNERAGLGLIWINDKSASNTLSVNKLYLSSAYFIRISQKSYLHMGMQAGYVLKNLDFSNLSFPDQFDMTSGYFNSNLYSNEVLENSRLSYLDLNWGLIWSYKTPEFTSEIGLAMFHYNTPKETFSGIDNELKPRYVYHAFFEKLLFKHYFIKPKILFVRQNSASELLLGFDTGLLFPENKISKSFYTGLFFRGGFNRTPNAFIFKAGFDYKDFDISVGYDFETLGGKQYVYTKNSLEISLIYRRPETNVKNKTIPCSIF